MSPTLLLCCLFFQGITPEVIEHAQTGAAALHDRHLDVAIQEFRKVIELDPKSASGYANLGEAYFQNGEYGEAIAALTQAIAINPKMIGTQQTLGVALLVEGNAEEALPHLEKTRTPELVGLAYLETGRLGSAIMALDSVLLKRPDDPDLLYYFGRATEAAGRQTAAQLAAIDPGRSKAARAPAPDKSPTREDLVALQKGLAEKPTDPELLARFSQAAAVVSRQAFDHVLQAGANSARAHQILAERFAGNGKLADAEREYRESIRLSPYTGEVHLALGRVLESQNKWMPAAVEYRQETTIRPLSVDGFYALGVLLLQHGQARQAFEEMDRADHLRPDTPPILLALGAAAAAAGDRGRAEDAWKHLLRLDPKDELAADAHRELAQLYRSTGKTEDAARETAAYQQLQNQGKPSHAQ